MIHRKFIYLTVVIIMLMLAGFPTKAMAQETSQTGFNGWGVRAGLSSDPECSLQPGRVDQGYPLQAHRGARHR